MWLDQGWTELSKTHFTFCPVRHGFLASFWKEKKKYNDLIFLPYKMGL